MSSSHSVPPATCIGTTVSSVARCTLFMVSCILGMTCLNSVSFQPLLQMQSIRVPG